MCSYANNKSLKAKVGELTVPKTRVSTRVGYWKPGEKKQWDTVIPRIKLANSQ